MKKAKRDLFAEICEGFDELREAREGKRAAHRGRASTQRAPGRAVTPKPRAPKS